MINDRETPISSDASAARYVWDADALLPESGKVAVAIGGLRLILDLQFPHERRYALGLIHSLRNPQADIDRILFQKYIKPGDVVLDAGSNIGVTAAEALACGASLVLCVEPESTLLERLALLKKQSNDRITIWPYALGAQDGVCDLLLSRSHNQGHTISPKMASLFPKIFDGTSQRVEVCTVDRVLASRPADIWKLDVEGQESDTIKGARSILERCPPRAIIAELYDIFVDEVVRLLSAYRVKRAVISRSDYTLTLLDQIGGALGEAFCPMSPTYVFIRGDLPEEDGRCPTETLASSSAPPVV